MRERITGTPAWKWYSGLLRATHMPTALNSNTISISTIIPAQSISESYHGEMVFLNSGL